MRRRVRELGDRAGRAETAQRLAEQALADERARRRAGPGGRGGAGAAHGGAAGGGRAGARGGPLRRRARGGHSDELRLRVLLDTLLGAAGGLRRELALAPLEGRPGRRARGASTRPGAAAGPPLQGRSADDPALLDALLAAPMVHLLVDGYNVTKGGYGEVSLEAQRAPPAGRARARSRRGPAPRSPWCSTARSGRCRWPWRRPAGVRLLFSREGETADEVLRRLARHEPPGRPVVVVSSDREVADGVRAAGARPVPSAALLRLLGRS